MKYSITVIYGKEVVEKYLNEIPLTDEEKSLNEKIYFFKSLNERNAFRFGIEEAIGWNEVHITSDLIFI